MRSLLDTCVEGLGSALHIAASQSRSSETLRLLLESGANVNNMCKGVGSPLHCAVTASTTSNSGVAILLEHGANASATDDCSTSALHYAILKGNLDHIKILQGYGADLNGRIGVHRNAAQTAGQHNDWKYMQALSRLGANVNAHDFSPSGPYENPGSAAMNWPETKVQMAQA